MEPMEGQASSLLSSPVTTLRGHGLQVDCVHPRGLVASLHTAHTATGGQCRSLALCLFWCPLS